MTTELTREQWLQKAVAYLRLDAADKGIVIPEVKVSCSWPGGGDSQKRIGECWSRAASQAKVNEIFISPKLEDVAQVISVLAHELMHAVDDCKNGHGAAFKALGTKMGLEGKATSMSLPGPVAAAHASFLVGVHGDYPHRTLDKSMSPVKKQKTRMIKCECHACGSVWRLTQSVIDKVEGEMSCPACHEGDGNVTVGG